MLLAVRLVQRSSLQFVLNALFGIGIGALFAWRAARGGGDEGEQALAYFLPGLLYNLGYGVRDGPHHRWSGGRWSASSSAASPATRRPGTPTATSYACAAG